MTYIPQEPVPEYHWVSAHRARRIASGTTVTGVLLLLSSLVLGGAQAAVGFGLPAAHDVFGNFAVVLVLCASLMLLIMGGGLLAARNYARGEYLNLAGATVGLRALLVVWLGTIPVTALGLFLLRTVFATRPQYEFTASAGVFVALAVLPFVLGGIGYFVSRNLLRLR
ncbi:hypothetical protein GCM10010174_64610 [Kutzneria viridogrisea]|uniref:Uncharacterized protein n=2 Tax=Kutzneria TaxID=43356 RepID=W5WI71_9PSEU|nr:hypothetical protein [Kutzneria albida]AHI00451.1 hypothetical protein KALB_7093 [Kutzneria albida DSM 43870]MBA8925630.1 hypothetical protein [Kutzneria viridogrisea]